MQMYLKTDHKSINQLFSSLDPDRTDRLDYRDFVAALRIFRIPTESVPAKIEALWEIYCSGAGSDDALLSKGTCIQIIEKRRSGTRMEHCSYRWSVFFDMISL